LWLFMLDLETSVSFRLKADLHNLGCVVIWRQRIIIYLKKHMFIFIFIYKAKLYSCPEIETPITF